MILYNLSYALPSWLDFRFTESINSVNNTILVKFMAVMGIIHLNDLLFVAGNKKVFPKCINK